MSPAFSQAPSIPSAARKLAGTTTGPVLEPLGLTGRACGNQTLGRGAGDEQAGCGGWLQVNVTEAVGCLEPSI